MLDMSQGLSSIHPKVTATPMAVVYQGTCIRMLQRALLSILPSETCGKSGQSWRAPQTMGRRDR